MRLNDEVKFVYEKIKWNNKGNPWATGVWD